MALAHKELSERVDEGALTHAGHPGDPHAMAAAGVGKKLVHQTSGENAIFVLRGLHKRQCATQDRPVPGEDAVAVVREVEHRPG
jgi:hypothetical protein